MPFLRQKNNEIAVKFIKEKISANTILAQKNAFGHSFEKKNEKILFIQKNVEADEEFY